MEAFPRFEPQFPLINGPVRLDQISLQQMIFLRREQEKEDFQRFTCRPTSYRTDQQLMDSYEKVCSERTVLVWGIYSLDGEDLLGKLTAADYNPRNSSAEIGYYLLPPHRDKSCMAKSLYTFCDTLFCLGGLNKLYAQTGAFNTPSVRLLEHLGFHRDGILRQHHELDGVLWDDYLYSLLANELPQI